MESIEKLGDLTGKTVLVRCDFNVPENDKGEITDDRRIRAAVPTLKSLLDRGAKLVIAAHLGRPKGKEDKAYSLAPVAQRLSELLSAPVILAKDAAGPDSKKLAKELKPGEVLLLENIRFRPEETSKDEAERMKLAEDLASLADLFVFDGFGVAHRKHASSYDVSKLLPSYMGLLVAKEQEALTRALEDPARPYTVVMGGAKVSDKLKVIVNLLDVADRILIAGGMAYTFIKANGGQIGQSLLEPDMLDEARECMRIAKEKGVEFLLPKDLVVADAFSNDASTEIVDSYKVPEDMMGMDVGPKTCEEFAAKIKDSKTVFWNGPLGVFEFPKFAEGTRFIAQAMKEATANGAFTIIGGGDSAAAVDAFGFKDGDFSHISTGGGASLEFLKGEGLPALEEK
ncbi:MAG: phosphoglycerate kinase [Aeriscardovia sp.]|nr:phosphoglycerate kinase [Aeriscardovia sp.]